MKNLIPDFIGFNLALKKTYGSFNGFILFVDIKGFTNMTETLMSKDKTGAEIISNILDNLFSPIVDSIYKNNGFVGSFIGDAIIVIFKEEDLKFLCLTLKEIKEILQNKSIQKTTFGSFSLSAKIGVAYGEIKWGIPGLDNHKSFYFKGEAIDKSIKNGGISTEMKIIADSNTIKLFDKYCKIKFIDEGYYEIYKIKDLNIKKIEKEERILTPAILSLFVPKELLKYNIKGEFREVISIFIGIKKKKNHKRIEKIISTIIAKNDYYGGYFNKIDFSDKGFTVVIFFGFPVTYENKIKRAMNFALSIKKELNNEIKIGMTFGITYCGLLGNNTRAEYTCLGDIVNLSARLMSATKFGHIWINYGLAENIKNEYEIIQIGSKKIKGKSEKVQIYELVSQKQSVTFYQYFSPMIGRDKELNKIKNFIEGIKDKKKSSILYIYGEAGIGKSRLIYEATKDIKEDFFIFTLQSDSIIKNSLNAFEYFLKKYFNLDLAKDENEKKIFFEKKYDELIEKLSQIKDLKVNKLVKELIRTRSFIASIIGIYYKNSPYESLDPKGRYENTLYAIKDFIIANSILKPTLIIFEDFHWIDFDSLEELKILSRNITDFPVGLIITSRINDDDTKPAIKLEEQILSEEIVLTSLSDVSSQRLIEVELTGNATQELKEFIISKTQSNPFYIEQFCLYLLENNLLNKKDGLFSLVSYDLQIPSSINSVIMARIDRLSSELKEAVQIASVIGMEFELKILQILINELMNNLNKESSDEIVIECEKQKIWISISELKYIFKHALLQQVAYEMQLRQRLTFIHNIIGQILEQLYGKNQEKYSEIAYHYDKAERFDKAIFYYEKAAEFLKFNYKNNELVNCYNRLFELENNILKKIEILINKGYILELMGKWDLAEESYKLALKLAEESRELKSICKSKEMLSSLLISKGSYEKAITLLDEASAVAKNIDDKRQYSFILKDYGNIYFNQGEYDKALEFYEEMKNLCYQINDKAGYSIAIENIGNVFADKGHYEKAMEYYEEKMEICKQINDKRGYSIAVGNMGLSYHYKGDFENALKCYEERKKICFEIGDKTGYCIAVGNIGNLYRDKFDYENAMKCFEEIKEIFLSMGDKRRFSIAIGNIGNLALCKGDFEIALDNFNLQKEITLLIGDKRGYVTSLMNIAKTLDSKKEYEKALKYYDEAIRLAKELHLDYHLCELLRKKADMLWEMNLLDLAETANEEAFEISNEIHSDENIFDCLVLRYTIKNDVSNLLNLLSSSDEDEKKASIIYSLYKITKDDQYKIKCKDLYKKLFDTTYFYAFKLRYDELNN